MGTVKYWSIIWLSMILLRLVLTTIYPIAPVLWTSLHQGMVLFSGKALVGPDTNKGVTEQRLFPRFAENWLLGALLAIFHFNFGTGMRATWLSSHGEAEAQFRYSAT